VFTGESKKLRAILIYLKSEVGSTVKGGGCKEYEIPSGWFLLSLEYR
jgi:hypothetical protein